jgi:hypothetical protein
MRAVLQIEKQRCLDDEDGPGIKSGSFPHRGVHPRPAVAHQKEDGLSTRWCTVASVLPMGQTYPWPVAAYRQVPSVQR